METKGNKPSLGWAILSLVLPVAMILYGTLVVGVRPPVLPLIGAVALAGLMGLKTGYRWEELQEGMFEALGRIQIAIAILALVGMIIAAWLASGTIPAIIYWGLKLIAPEHFLLSAMCCARWLPSPQALRSGPWGPSAWRCSALGRRSAIPRP